MPMEGCAPTDEISLGLGNSNYKNFGIRHFGEGKECSLIQNERKTFLLFKKGSERLRMINCQYQIKCESQRVCLVTYK